MTSGEGTGEDRVQDESRRDFLKVAAAVSAGLAVAGIASVMKSVVIPAVPGTQTTSEGFPRVRIASLASLTTGSVVAFNYPLDNEPNLLVKLGTKAAGGVGPDGDVVAFSQICQHLGCPSIGYVPSGGSPSCRKSYSASSPIGYCCCHGSVFDFENQGKVLGGPSPRPLPQVILEVDASGEVYATGMGPPSVFGHNTGSSDVNDDLSGGNLV